MTFDRAAIREAVARLQTQAALAGHRLADEVVVRCDDCGLSITGQAEALDELLDRVDGHTAMCPRRDGG